MRHWNLSEEGKSWHVILCGCEGALMRVLWLSVTMKLHKGCCLWGKNYQPDSPLELIKSWFLKPKSPGNVHIHYFCQEGRADSGTGELGQFVETPTSAWNITALPIFTHGQTSDLWRAWRIPGGGNTWLRKVKCLFIQTTVQCTELPELVDAATWAAAVVFVQEMPGSHSSKHEEMPIFPRTLSVLESRTPLKEMGLNRGVLAFPFTAQSWAFCFCRDLHFGN